MKTDFLTLRVSDFLPRDRFNAFHFSSGFQHLQPTDSISLILLGNLNGHRFSRPKVDHGALAISQSAPRKQ